MVERDSPLLPVYRPGTHGNLAGGIGVRLAETRPGSIVQLASWPGEEKALMQAIGIVTALALPDGAGGGTVGDASATFGIGPGRFLVVAREEALAGRLNAAIGELTGTITDLSHGRTAIRVSGPKAEWVLAKLFAIDFSLPAFPEGAGRATAHHDIQAQIQRSGPDRFDLYVFRSFARSFWVTLCDAAEEVGYEVA